MASLFHFHVTLPTWTTLIWAMYLWITTDPSLFSPPMDTLSSNARPHSATSQSVALDASALFEVTNSLPIRSRRGSDASDSSDEDSYIPMQTFPSASNPHRKPPELQPGAQYGGNQNLNKDTLLFFLLTLTLASGKKPNDEAPSNGKLDHSDESTPFDILASMFKPSNRFLAEDPRLVAVREMHKSAVPRPHSAGSDDDATVISAEDRPTANDWDKYPRNLDSYHSDEDFSTYWVVGLEGLSRGTTKFTLDFLDLAGGQL
jgi:hypothetical protein